VRTSRLVDVLGTRRVAALDIGRFGACWYVMLFHAAIDTGSGATVLELGYAGVQFFMMLSGYVLARPYLELRPQRPFELRRYAVGRVTRILPPYYVVVLLAAVLAFLQVGVSATRVARGDLGWHVFTHLTLTHSLFPATHRSLLAVLWSLGLEWQYYLVLPLLLLAFRAWKALPIMLVVIVTTLVARAALPAVAPPGSDLMNGFFLARWTEFAAGVCVAALLGQGWGHSRLLALAIALGAAGFSWSRGSNDREIAVQGIVLVSFVLLRLYGPVTAVRPWTRAMQFLGEVSYSTYLVHTLGGEMLFALFARLPATVALGPWPRILLYAVAGQIAGIAFYFLVERPTTRLAAGVLDRRARPVVGSARLSV